MIFISVFFLCMISLILFSIEISDQVRYKLDPTSERKLPVVHQYYVTNSGPSYLPFTIVNITVPIKEKQFEIDITVSVFYPVALIDIF